MKTFEMPKMNVAIFSLEDVITTSNVKTNLEAAKDALTAAEVVTENVTTTSVEEWINA